MMGQDRDAQDAFIIAVDIFCKANKIHNIQFKNNGDKEWAYITYEEDKK